MATEFETPTAQTAPLRQLGDYILLEEIGRVGEFDAKPGTGIAFQIDVEDAVGISHQMKKLTEEVEDLL